MNICFSNHFLGRVMTLFVFYCFAMISQLAKADSSESSYLDFVDGQFHFRVLSMHDKTCSIMGFSGYSGEDETLTFPTKAVYNGSTYKVKMISSLEEPAGRVAIYGEIVVPGSIEVIYGEAFRYCKMKSIKFSEGVREIGSKAFQYCYNLKEISLPKTIMKLGSNILDDTAFYADCADGMIVVGNYVVGRKNWAPSGSLEIEEGIEGICDDAFYYGSGQNVYLSTIKLPSTLRFIGNNAFRELRFSGNLSIPDNVVSIGDAAFYKVALYNLELGRSLKEIGTYSFYSSFMGQSLKMPYSLESIGGCAFENSMYLTSVMMGRKIESIGARAFYGCSALTDFNIPESTVFVDATAFMETKWWSSQNSGDIYKDNCLLRWCKNPIVKGTRVVAGYCCMSIKNFPQGDITIPDGVVSIGEYTSLTSNKNVTNISLPNSLKYIFKMGVSGGDMERVILPENLEVLSGSNFQYCRSLVDMSFPDNLERIEEGALNGCSNLETIRFGKGLKYIDYSAFRYCPKIKNIYCYSYLPPEITTCMGNDYKTGVSIYYKYDIFSGITNRDYCILHVPSDAYELYSSTYPWNLFYDIIPDLPSGVELIDNDLKNYVSVQDGMIVISTGEESIVEVYDINGRQIFCGFTNNINVDSGFYVVKVGDNTCKVFVK